MLTDLEQGDVAQTIASFYEKSSMLLQPTGKGSLTINDVDNLLDQVKFNTLHLISPSCVFRDDDHITVFNL